MSKKLSRNADVLNRLDLVRGDQFRSVGEYWGHLCDSRRVELIDLHEVAPDLRPPV